MPIRTYFQGKASRQHFSQTLLPRWKLESTRARPMESGKKNISTQWCSAMSQFDGVDLVCSNSQVFRPGIAERMLSTEPSLVVL
ncbi:hypothetical protein EMCRGX_G033607 [Ephydatia muelleri]